MLSNNGLLSETTEKAPPVKEEIPVRPLPPPSHLLKAGGISKSSAFVLLVVILTISLFLQIVGINKMESNPDECRLVESALLLPEGFHPLFWDGYAMPGIWLWSAAINGGWAALNRREISAMAHARQYKDILDSFERARQKIYTNPNEINNILRWINALATVMIALMSYLLAARVSGYREAGLVAAAICAVSPLAVRWGTDFHPDQFQGLFTAICVYFCVGEAKRSGDLQWLGAAIFGGIAMTARFIMGILLAPLILAIIIGGLRRPIRMTFRRLIGATAVLFASYLILDPCLLTGFSTFIKGIFGRWFVLYAGRSLLQYGATGLPALIHMVFSNVGYGALGLAAVGLIWGLARRTSCVLLLATTIVLFCALLSPSHTIRPPYMITLLPLVAAMAGIGFKKILDSVPQRKLILAATVIMLLAAAMLNPILNSFAILRMRHNGDTRTVARQWIAENIPAGSRIFADYSAPLLSYDRASVQSWRAYYADFMGSTRPGGLQWEFLRNAKVHEEEYTFKKFLYLNETQNLPSPGYDLVELFEAPNDPTLLDGLDRYWVVVDKSVFTLPQKPGLVKALVYKVRKYGRLVASFSNTNMMGPELYICLVDMSAQ